MHLYLFSVQCVSTTRDTWDRKPLLFFVDERGDRHTYRVRDFLPHILVRCGSDDLEPSDVEDMLSEELLDLVDHVDAVTRTPLIGFTNNRQDRLFRIFYRELRSKYRLRKHLETLDVTILHRGLTDELQLLHTTGLRLQQWYRLSSASAAKLGNTGISGTISWRSLEHAAEAPMPIPPLSFAYIRLVIRSSTATAANVFLPDHAIEGDAIQACEVRLGHLHAEQVDTVRMQSTTEADVIDAISSWLTKHNPCILVHMSDPLDALAYLHFRAKRNRRHSGLSAIPSALPIENVNVSDGSFRDVSIPGRETMDILHVLQKFMVSPNLDGYSLADAYAHPKLIRDKSSIQYAGDIDTTFRCLSDRMAAISSELDVMCALQKDNAFIMNNLALSGSCDLPLFKIISRGQQARVFACFARAYYEDGIYINHTQLDRPYTLVRRRRCQSSFADPPWIENPPLEALRRRDTEPGPGSQKRKRSVLDILGRPPKAAKPKMEKRYGGGFVIVPEPGFYRHPWEAVCTMDFASLYPSIMEGYRICYMRLCFEERWLHDDRATKEYIPLDDDTCCVFIKEYDNAPVRSITDRIVSAVVQNRKRVRAQIKLTDDTFLRQSLDAQQLCCKILQNAFYGACGSETFAIPCTAIAASVCVIGQWMNKTLRHCAMSRGCRCVYGDTDSGFFQFPTDPGLTSADDILRDIYRQAKDLELDTTRLFNAPNAVEFETLKWPHLQTSKKKTYAAREYPPTDAGWTETPTALVKGFAFKKRDRCPFVYAICKRLMDHLFSSEMTDDRIAAWYRGAITDAFKVRPGEADLGEFIITCRLNHVYKQDDALALILAEQYEAETGSRPRAGQRLRYLVAKFDGPKRKLADRVVTPATFVGKGYQVDAVYYLQTQLLLPIKQALDLRPSLYRRIDRITARLVARYTLQTRGLGVIVSQ